LIYFTFFEFLNFELKKIFKSEKKWIIINKENELIILIKTNLEEILTTFRES